jgi:hypothetical protein
MAVERLHAQTPDSPGKDYFVDPRGEKIHEGSPLGKIAGTAGLQIPVSYDASPLRLLDSQEALDQGAFSRSVFPGDAKIISLLYFKVEPLYYGEPLPFKGYITAGKKGGLLIHYFSYIL